MSKKRQKWNSFRFTVPLIFSLGFCFLKKYENLLFYGKMKGANAIKPIRPIMKDSCDENKKTGAIFYIAI